MSYQFIYWRWQWRVEGEFLILEDLSGEAPPLRLTRDWFKEMP
jgi:hypothetical protein